MSIRERVQEDMKTAMKAGEKDRLECLRMVKAALLMKEKETGSEISDEVAVAALRGEIRKRQQSLELFRELGKPDEAAKTEVEIQIIDAYLPKQLSPEETESRVRAYLAAHPELNHAGKLTGAMKKELGDLVDGKTLNEVCKKVLE